jgi:glucose-6-phosphate isomerase
MTFALSTSGLDVPGTLRDSVREDRVAARLVRKDATLWGPEAESEAAIRLGWLDLPASSLELVSRLAELKAELAAEGLDRVVLCGMGGSSLAPEVVCRTAGLPLVVLDTTDPGQVAAAMTDLARTVVVVSSKSGGTVETDSQRRAFIKAFADQGLDEKEIGRRFVVVTDPGSPLADTGSAMGARAVFLADPTVGGRYSALSSFGLVPAALAGADVGTLLEDAEQLAEHLADQANAALALGVALGAGYRGGRDKVNLADGTGVVGFGDWAEQLIAESTGKDGKGILPVVLESVEAPGAGLPGTVLAQVGGDAPVPGPSLGVTGPLGAQFLGWEYATAVAGLVIGINPFDQPNVTESKENTQRILSEGLPDEPPLATIGAVEIRSPGGLLDGVDLTPDTGLAGALETLLAAVPERGYLAVMAYLDRERDASAADLRPLLAQRTEHAVTFGWGPRFLHSTGQYHKGGPQTGVFLQLTGASEADVPVPGRAFTLGRLQLAQALGDLGALRRRGRPAVRLHLRDREAGLRQLLAAAGAAERGAVT